MPLLPLLRHTSLSCPSLSDCLTQSMERPLWLELGPATVFDDRQAGIPNATLHKDEVVGNCKPYSHGEGTIAEAMPVQGLGSFDVSVHSKYHSHQ